MESELHRTEGRALQVQPERHKWTQHGERRRKEARSDFFPPQTLPLFFFFFLNLLLFILAESERASGERREGGRGSRAPCHVSRSLQAGWGEEEEEDGGLHLRTQPPRRLLIAT